MSMGVLILKAIGVIAIFNVVGLIGWMLLVLFRRSHQESVDPLTAINNHFASDKAIQTEDAAIARARKLFA